MGSQKRLLWLIGSALAVFLARPGFSADEAVPGFGERPFFSTGFSPDMQPMSVEFEALPAEFAESSGAVRPAWYFHAEGMALTRDVRGNQLLAAFIDRQWREQGASWVSSDRVTYMLESGDLKPGYRGGGRVMLARTLGTWHAVEVSYFALSEWSKDAAVRDATEFIAEVDGGGAPTVTYPASLFSILSNFGNPAVVGLDYNDLVYASYASKLDNLEWNFRQWVLLDPRRLQVSVLVGGRYMNLDERFYYHTESAVPAPGGAANSITTDTANGMLGVQVGAMFKFHADPGWWIDFEIKGAAFDNAANQRTLFENQGAAAYQGQHVGSSTGHTSTFALDLKLTITMQVTPQLAVRGGYQALWLDGLALAPENLSHDPAILAHGPATLATNGKVAYHGPHLGITWIW